MCWYVGEKSVPSWLVRLSVVYLVTANRRSGALFLQTDGAAAERGDAGAGGNLALRAHVPLPHRRGERQVRRSSERDATSDAPPHSLSHAHPFVDSCMRSYYRLTCDPLDLQQHGR